ncbi:MAG: trypsin-like serine protease, partial [Bacteroidetes bacterium]|nr:trypsin-like serine protease [Bacteroidota bacterium]
MIKRFALIISLVTVSIINYAQNSNNFTPASFNNQLISTIPIVEINNQILRSPITDGKFPLQAGYTLPLTKEVVNKGKWAKIGEINIWQLEIFVQNAHALNLYLQNINLAEDDKMFIFNPDKNEIIELAPGTTCTDFISGDRIIIELNTKVLYENIPISIDEVGVRFSSPTNLTRGFGGAGDCEVHVNCVEGEYWQNEKNGIARILVKQDNLTFWCTGSLINNTRNDGTPYFLTANHCGELSDSTDYSKWLFYFNYESENCAQPIIEPEYNTVSGSTLLAKSPSGTNTGSDFKLLLLNDFLPDAYKPYYNGWDKSGVASPSGVTIHHPQGDVKMISTYTNQLVSTKYDNTNEDPDGMYWQVYWSETQSGHGVTEGGSSGSPIFNNLGYVVGALTGGSASCAFLNEPDYYGKLSYSWETTSPDHSNTLGYWLDPMNSGVTTLKGTNLDSTNIFAGFSGEPKSIIVGESVAFINTSFGNITGY